MMRRKKMTSSGPNKSYLVSFGDTMTALLAFFIVLNSLAEEQSGANLYEGTGSFVRVLNSFGLPGLFFGNRSERPYQMQETNPHYLAPSERQMPDVEKNPNGPDAVDDQQRVIDYEFEAYQRFLHELDRLHTIHLEPDVTGEVAFDRLNPLSSSAPWLDAGFRDMLAPIAPLLQQQQYAVELVVWATTPHPNAWSRAAARAEELRAEIIHYLSLSPEQAVRLTAVGRPWISSTDKRPSASVVVRRLRPPAARP
jgi:flagellar motor protein MotB